VLTRTSVIQYESSILTLNHNIDEAIPTFVMLALIPWKISVIEFTKKTLNHNIDTHSSHTNVLGHNIKCQS
jgi:hypothetical protein